MEKEYYMVEIPYPTSSGYYSTRKIFTTEDAAMAFIENYLKENHLMMDDLIDMKNEWTGCGPNWETLHEWHSEDGDMIDLTVIHQ